VDFALASYEFKSMRVSLSLSFLVCKMGTILRLATSESSCEDKRDLTRKALGVQMLALRKKEKGQ
jgi:hypothetical protein